MAHKENESTPLRPDGDRTIDAPLVCIDVPKFVKQITSEESWFKSDRNAITVFKTPAYRIVVVGLKANAEMNADDENLINGIVTINVLQGQLHFSTDGQPEQVLNNGSIAVLHENLPYRIKALDTTLFLLCVSGNNP